jgi:hypothetical protein
MRRISHLALLLALVAGVPAAAAPGDTGDAGDARPLPFLSDDYARALGEARSRALPLFIEAWAPW